MRFCKKNIFFLNVTTTFLYFFLFCLNIIFFSFSTTRQKLQKIGTCFPEDKISQIYHDLQIQKAFTPRLLMHGFSFWSISEHLNLLQYMYIYIFFF